MKRMARVRFAMAAVSVISKQICAGLIDEASRISTTRRQEVVVAQRLPGEIDGTDADLGPEPAPVHHAVPPGSRSTTQRSIAGIIW